MTLRMTIALLAAVLALAACEPPEESPIQDEPLEAEASDTAEALATEPGALSPINRSGVRGRAELSQSGDEVLVVVQADSLEPGALYTAHLHEGRCADGGPSDLPLGRITADQRGSGSSRMELEADRLPAASELFVQVNDSDDEPVACADLDAGLDADLDADPEESAS